MTIPSKSQSQEPQEPLTLIDKIVKARDVSRGIDNSNIIPFMYPSFIKKDELFFDYENSVIIDMPYKFSLAKDLKRTTKHFIAICDSGIPDIDFTDRSVILQVLRDHHKGKFSQERMALMRDMSEQDFWYTFKIQWIGGQKLHLLNLRYTIFTRFSVKIPIRCSTPISGCVKFIQMIRFTLLF